MIYIRRELERKFLRMSEAFKAVMVVGARQVGKSTMLKQLAKDQNRAYVTMDDTQLRQFAQSDPKLFLQTYRPPILIDEVQKAPELFERIKILCDESEEKGLFSLFLIFSSIVLAFLIPLTTATLISLPLTL